jgi:hypothetical protein
MTTRIVWEFDTSKVFFNPPSYNKKGQKIVDISMKQGSTQYADRLFLQLCPDTHMCTAQWGLSSGKPNGVPDRREPDITRRDWKMIHNSPASFEKLKEFDEFILNTAFENLATWFPKKNYTKEQLKEKYKGAIRDGDISVLKVKCPDPKGLQKPTEIKRLNDDNTFEPGFIEDLLKNTRTIPVVSVYNIWFMMDGSFGITLQADKLIIKPVAKRTFLDGFILTNPLVEVGSVEDDEMDD